MRIETSRLYIRRLLATDWREMKNIFSDFNHSPYVVYDMPLPTEEKEAKALTKRFAVCSYASFQFNDYSKYDVMEGTQEYRAKYRDEQLPKDLEPTFDLGKRLVQKAKER